MVTIFNKSNRPIGIAGQSVLPDKEIKIKDKDAYCDVYDGDGIPTGEKALLPGLLALKGMNFVTITEEKEVSVKAGPIVSQDAAITLGDATRETNVDDGIEFASMTKEQLLKYAEDNGVTGVSAAMKKADILAAIENAVK